MSINMNKTKDFFGNSLLQIVLIFWALLQITPILWQIISSFKTTSEIFLDLFSFPKALYLGNYDFARFAEMGIPLGIYFRNSLIITLSTLAILGPLAYAAAYAIAKIKFRGKNIIIFLLVALIGVPMHSLLVPLYYEILNMGLLNRYFGLILPYIAYFSPFAILLLQSFFRGFPDELIEAAKIDGCNNFQAFIKVVLPISAGALSTVFIINFIQIWNEFLLALVIMTNNNSRTLPVGIVAFQGAWMTDWGPIYAALVITILPTIIVYLIFHRNIIKGVTAGAVKG